MSPAEHPAGRGFVALNGPVSPREARLVCDRVRAVLSAGVGGISCRVAGPIDLSVVDLLAQLHLLARRYEARLDIRADGEQWTALTTLLTFTGLDQVVGNRSLGGPASPADRRL